MLLCRWRTLWLAGSSAFLLGGPRRMILVAQFVLGCWGHLRVGYVPDLGPKCGTDPRTKAVVVVVFWGVAAAWVRIFP